MLSNGWTVIVGAFVVTSESMCYNRTTLEMRPSRRRFELPAENLLFAAGRMI